MKKIIYVCVILFLFMTNLTALSEKEPELVVGTTSGYAPFVSLNDKGEYEGFDIDMAQDLAKKLKCSFVIKDCGCMPGLMLALKQKKVDLVIWAVSITEQRLKNMEMVYYQGDKIDKMPIVFWGKIPKDIKSFQDLAKDPEKIVCVEAGSYQEQVLKAYNIPLKYLDKVTDVILDLKYDKSFASAIDPALVLRYKAKYPKLQVLYLSLPDDYQSLGNGVCIDKSNRELTEKIRKAVQEIIDEGKIRKLEKKWGLK
ncbi:MAG: amino acid ABC transporter substrate-binding protein [Parachlamydiales bacterium]|nr:amino acid ABC transporter substrate-binding protein [Parachlamydiales bacterium]